MRYVGKNGKKSNVDTWWTNEEVKGQYKERKNSHKSMCQNST